ncbi:MAG TPA: glycosyltransferase family 4 protein [Steroidobacteraceae bacterium]
MSAVLFFDPGCPTPYSRRTLEQAALGGTEATVVRIVEALDAEVMQHNRTESEGRYRPGSLSTGTSPVPPARGLEHLIILRDPRAVPPLCARFPGARPYLWLHDLVRPGSKRGRRLAAAAGALAQLGVTLVCVSEFQRAQAQAVLERAGAAMRVRAVTIYNPIDDTLIPSDEAVDTEKLVFLSSPNKGLPFALDAFEAVRHALPGMRLCVGSPGYKSFRDAGVRGPAAGTSGIEWLGPLPHARAVAEMRSALCLFYPNFVLPETFGLVFAEANAIGTPVLTHDCGAAAEVLADPRQLLPVAPAARRYERTTRLLPGALRPMLAARAERRGLFEPYVERVRTWRSDRPRVSADPRFRLAAVAERWRALLNAG